MNGFYIGDIIGNSYAHENESFNEKTKEFPLFTNRSKFSDDTILTFATIDWLLKKEHTSQAMLKIIKKFYSKFPDTKPTIYGREFAKWIETNPKQSRVSSGNGGVMRVSPIGWYATTIEEIKELVDKAISPTHNSDEAKEAAEVCAISIFMFRNNIAKKTFIKYMKDNYKYDLNESIDKLREEYKYTTDAKETLRPALISVLQSENFEDAIRNAVSLGGDTDTITSICASLAEAYYQEVPTSLVKEAKSYLPKYFKDLVGRFKRIVSEKHS